MADSATCSRRAEIVRIDRDFGKTGLCLQASGIEFGGITEALLGNCHVALGARGPAEPDLDDETVGIGFGGFLQFV